MKTVQVDASSMSTGPVKFTRKQYEYLNKVYGEAVGNPTTPAEELRWKSGARAVVLHVRGLVDEKLRD